ncbi:lysophospholipid acyltransferase family protein [Actinosynnema mirum]|uniref:Phospholipid/glycerol acyltransferase n=2 Tax=Actinosynnema TaxID=40566 RepID=C6WG91_ACTMD|nr:lysophospholipid acyltransferase family protein [Actinosynnema mirum]ACU39855.1 phospholipid/glycerol acyltransferase [Actinosynnema mirum DSM 43827]AXX33370.1 1-acyl-sn-glycerol-3-phosphate acyltransferase [Actinosynnema pretiosum subsp. pretiosum]
MAAHAWMPLSPCGDGCVAEGATVGRARAVLRFAGLAGVLAAGALVAPVVLVLRGRAREAVLRGWFRLMVRASGVGMRVVGERRFQGTPGRGVLVVANHVSWLDELVVDSVQPIRIVAKRDIRSWPVLGWIITAARTVYLDRERLRLLPGTVAELAAALRSGAAVGVHAEGTTWCGSESGPFRPALFQAALDAGVPVRPVALRYLRGGVATTRPAYVGADGLVDAIWRVVRTGGLVVEVHVLDEIAPGRAADRRELAALAQSATERVLPPGAAVGAGHRAVVAARAPGMVAPGVPARVVLSPAVLPPGAASAEVVVPRRGRSGRRRLSRKG